MTADQQPIDDLSAWVLDGDSSCYRQSDSISNAQTQGEADALWSAHKTECPHQTSIHFMRTPGNAQSGYATPRSKIPAEEEHMAKKVTT